MTNPNPTLEDAITLATQLHRGQVDKAGSPYILHALRVMCDPILCTEEERIIAVLHDIIEDCDISVKYLRELGYGESILEALTYLTKTNGETYDAFIARIASGPVLAQRVKLADLRDNSKLSRIINPSKQDLKRHDRYQRAIATLVAGGSLF